MAGRKQTPAQKAAISAIERAVVAGLDPASLRENFTEVPERTWFRWVAQAKRNIAGRQVEIAAAPAVVPPPPPPPQAAPAVGSEAQEPARKRSRRGTKAKEGELIHARDAPPAKDRPNGPPDVMPDTGTYVITTPFGPMEVGVTERWRNPKSYDPSEPLNYLLRMMDVYLDGEALRDSALKRVPGGHVILNANAFAQAAQIRMQALDRIFKALEKAKSLSEAKRFAATIIEHIRKRVPADVARSIIADLRSAATTPELWQTPQAKTGATSS